MKTQEPKKFTCMGTRCMEAKAPDNRRQCKASENLATMDTNWGADVQEAKATEQNKAFLVTDIFECILFDYILAFQVE